MSSFFDKASQEEKFFLFLGLFFARAVVEWRKDLKTTF